ncbi:MAG: hypothetical protein ACSHXJ_03820 [Marinomonas colpomeniae]
MTSLNQIYQDTALSIQGCGYRIENDRVIISIEHIGNHRSEDSISGTLRLQLCAFPQNMNALENEVLASTTIGEIKGQHFIPDGHYDLIFQQPSTGIWQLALQLSEWNGIDYALYDTVYFDIPYQTPISSTTISNVSLENTAIEQATPNPQNLNIDSMNPVMKSSLVPDTQTLTPSIVPPQKSQKRRRKKVDKVEDSGLVEGYLAINKSKAQRILNVKGVPKASLEKLILERPFQSERAILNIKGIGPAMLKKILAELAG